MAEDHHVYFGSNDKYVCFQKTLIHIYIKGESLVVAEYFSTETLSNMKKLGFSQTQLSEKFRQPQLVAFTVTSNIELAILAPYLLLCDATKSEFRLWQLGDYEKAWDINLSEKILDATFCGAIIMDGPMIAFIYQNVSEDDFSFFEENNTHIVLWRPLLSRNMLCTLSLLAHSIQGFWLPHQQYGIVDDVDEPYRFINVVFRPLYESRIIMRNFFENFPSPIPYFISAIPDYYSKHITCLLRTNHLWNNEEIIWIGTSKGNIICIKNVDNIGDIKPIWCTDITSIPLKMEEVQLGDKVGGLDSVLIIYFENGLTILNSDNGKKLREFSNKIILLFGDFYQCGYQSIVQVPCRFNNNLILINNINVENDNTKEGNISHLSSLLDSLLTRIYDGTAQIRKIEEMIDKKYNLLEHSDSILHTFSYLMGLYYLKRTKFTKQILRHSKHTEGLVPLISHMRTNTSKEICTNPEDKSSYIEIIEAKTNIGKFNHNENILIEISVRNKSFQELYAVHLVTYFKNTSNLMSSMLKSNSSYINLLHIGETRTIFALIDLPLDLVSDYLEFGAFILYCRIDESYVASNSYQNSDKMIWETLCVKKIKKAGMINQDFVHLLPSMIYLIFTTTNSLNCQWSISLLPFLLEQYLGVISKDESKSEISKDYRHLDGLRWIKIFRSYKCLNNSVNEVDQFSRVTKQIMAMRGHNDRYLIKMLVHLLNEDILLLKKYILFTLPFPLFTSMKALNSLNNVLHLLEQLIIVCPNIEDKGKNVTVNGSSGKLRCELCILATTWLYNL
ncbi:7157_t:CDS:10 [Funneliformis geosporum]|uniref:9988_t:CDS:1 n=1 Tax=Funneliformis geosporum TaxID=1117311 RepID=A0A9W4SBS1_9GLOM|nr:9988_t:CDS:10 [Funneliformis geosporum]CAI2188640.1 7157_t:CDS:10 [Funneliformis geosporum]